MNPVILWVALFLIIVGISFVMAFRSMRDYQEIPGTLKLEYGLFLIRNLQNFNPAVLENLGREIVEKGLVVGVERLFKGSESALTIFGPKKILEGFRIQLGLLELEDYTRNFDSNDFVVWEMGVKDKKNFNPANLNNIFSNLPKIEQEDQFFWQVILGPAFRKTEGTFQTQIRAAFHSQDPFRKKNLIPLLQQVGEGELVKIPRPFSNEKMIEFYSQRIFEKGSQGPNLGYGQTLSLLKI